MGMEILLVLENTKKSQGTQICGGWIPPNLSFPFSLHRILPIIIVYMYICRSRVDN